MAAEASDFSKPILEAAVRMARSVSARALMIYAAAITKATKSIALTCSESTGTVRIWRRGKLITEIEKGGPSRPPPASTPGEH